MYLCKSFDSTTCIPQSGSAKRKTATSKNRKRNYSNDLRLVVDYVTEIGTIA